MKKPIPVVLLLLGMGSIAVARNGTVFVIDKIAPKNAAFTGVVDSSQTLTNTTNFNHNLSGADTTVQKALDTLDDMASGGGGGSSPLAISSNNVIVSSPTGNINFMPPFNVTLQGSTSAQVTLNSSSVTLYGPSIPYSAVLAAPPNGAVQFSSASVLTGTNDFVWDSTYSSLGVKEPSPSSLPNANAGWKFPFHSLYTDANIGSWWMNRTSSSLSAAGMFVIGGYEADMVLQHGNATTNQQAFYYRVRNGNMDVINLTDAYGINNYIYSSRYDGRFTLGNGSGNVSWFPGVFNVSTLDTTIPQIYVKAATSQTADLTVWEDDAETPVARVSNTGEFRTLYFEDLNNTIAYMQTNTDSTHAWRLVNRTSTKVPFSVVGAGSQSANLQEWQNSSTVVLSSISASGGATFPSIADTGLASGQCVQTGTGGLLTVTGAACASGSGGTSVAVTTGASSSYTSPPTVSAASAVVFDSNYFTSQLMTGTSVFISLNPTTNGSNACTGCIGEYISSNAVATLSLTPSNTYKDFISISLSSGDWDVSGAISFDPNGSSGPSSFDLAMSTYSGDTSTGLADTLNQARNYPASATAGNLMYITIPRMRLNISQSFTCYLKARAIFSSGTPQVKAGNIIARRMR